MREQVMSIPLTRAALWARALLPNHPALMADAGMMAVAALRAPELQGPHLWASEFLPPSCLLAP
jgi:hypothetical protein